MHLDEVLRTDDWSEVETMLIGYLCGLVRHGFVTLDLPEPTPTRVPAQPPRRGLLGRLRGRRRVIRDRPLVQLARADTYLDAECSGPVDAGADYGFPWDRDQQRRLLELGWQPPEDIDDWHMYRWYGAASEDPAGDLAVVPQAMAAAAARLVVSTLRDVYAMRSPAGIRLVVDRSPSSPTSR